MFDFFNNIEQMRLQVLRGLIVVGLTITQSPAWAADVAGSKDHPLVSRYGASEIITYSAEAFSDYGLVTGPVKQSGKDKNPGVVQKLEGKVTEITYKAPDDRSTLEIYRNYETEFKKSGLEEIFSCANESCGGMPFSYTVVTTTPMVGNYADQRYYAGKLKRNEGNVYVALYINHNKAAGHKYAHVKLDVIEVAPMEAGLVKVDASAMAQEILKEGHIALYGIYFDTDQATLKPESSSTLDEIAKLMKDNPTLKLVIVGHTDNVGDLDYNMQLSKRRAEAVQIALVSSHDVDASRLKAWGAGYLSPIASNKTEAGRAKNRRVELVEQ